MLVALIVLLPQTTKLYNISEFKTNNGVGISQHKLNDRLAVLLFSSNCKHAGVLYFDRHRSCIWREMERGVGFYECLCFSPFLEKKLNVKGAPFEPALK